MNKIKQNSAITLIALVITIIVLLILAAVTLNIVLGEKGIFNKARTSKEKMEYASAKEIVDLKILEINSEIAINGGEFIEKADVNIKADGQITIQKYYYKLSASTTVSRDINQKLSGMVVSVNAYPKYKFLIGEEGTIDGITTGVVPDKYDENKFESVTQFEQNNNFGSETGTNSTPVESQTAGKAATASNRSLSGETTGYSYKNPIIPQGFSAIDTAEASWTYTDDTKTEVTGWNNGLVIQDAIGNQFVWVPVDGTNVKYEKWCTLNESYSNCSDVSDTSGTYRAVPVTESTQITNYGGFYVARFEAGNTVLNLVSTSDSPNNRISTPVSKKGIKIWNNISYNNAYKSANLMINNSEIYGNVKSGLITGTQWDTIMKWYKNSGIGIGSNDGTTQDWGTYCDLTYKIQSGYYCRYTDSIQDWQTTNSELTHVASSETASESEPHHYHASGLNNDNYRKNIADISGNFSEWTAEAWSDQRVIRSGTANDIANNLGPAPHRFAGYADAYDFYISFRCVLYIQ